MNKKRIFQRPLSSRLKTKEAHCENDSGTQHSDIWISTANVVKTLVSETEKSWRVQGKGKGPQGHQARGYTKEVIVEQRVCLCGCVSMHLSGVERRTQGWCEGRQDNHWETAWPAAAIVLHWASAEEMKQGANWEEKQPHGCATPEPGAAHGPGWMQTNTKLNLAKALGDVLV